MIETVLLPQGQLPGHTQETLRDRRYFTVDSEADLEKKWRLILDQRPDFIKTMLLFSDEFEKRKDDPDYFGQKGLDPRLLPKIVARAHASGLRVSTHVANAADFHNAVAAGVDEVAHLPAVGESLIPVEDAKLAAKKGIVVVTTSFRAVPSLIRLGVVSEADVRKTLLGNLKLLHENGVTMVIGSDDVADTSAKEFEHLAGLGVFDNVTLLKMWAEATRKAIFPERRIGELREGYEASFLALEGNPLDDLKNVRRIRHRFKQGFLLKR